jgi:hypothetical protein
VTSARAALFCSTSLFLVHHGVHHLQHGRISTHARARTNTCTTTVRSSLSNRYLSNCRHTTRAALRSILSLASRTFALQLTLWLGTVSWLGTLVLAVQLFAHWSAFWFGSHAGGVATSRLADSLALRAAVLLAQVLGATDSAHWTLAVDCALSAGDLFTLHFTLRTCAHWVAHCRASGVVTLPFAHWVALVGDSHSHKKEESDQHSLHLVLG